MVGIGHERDRSVLDELAQSCKTPTHAATVLVEQVRDWHMRFELAAERIEQVALTQLTQRRDALLRSAQTLDSFSRRLIAVQRARVIETTPDRVSRAVEARWQRERAGLDNAARVVRHLAPSRTQGLAQSLQALEVRLGRVGERRLSESTQVLGQVSERLGRAAEARVREASQTLAHASALVRSADPQRVLERGFALVEREDGASVSRASKAQTQMMLRVRFADGTLSARVEDRMLREGAEDSDGKENR